MQQADVDYLTKNFFIPRLPQNMVWYLKEGELDTVWSNKQTDALEHKPSIGDGLAALGGA